MTEKEYAEVKEHDQARLYRESKARAEECLESQGFALIVTLIGLIVIVILGVGFVFFLSGCATMKMSTPDGCVVCSERSLTLLGTTELTATTTVNPHTGTVQESCSAPGQSASGIISSLAAAGLLVGTSGVAAPPQAVRASAPTSCGGAAQ